MIDRGLRQDLPQAVLMVWLILGALSGLLVVAPLLVPASLLFRAFPICSAKAAGSACAFCGMTTAFVSIGRGDMAGASEANAGAIPLYAALLVNFATAAAYTIVRVKRHANP